MEQQPVTPETVKRRLERLTAGPVWRFLGLCLMYAENGKSEVQLPVKGEFTQLHGSVHGGILATVLDASMGAAVNSVLPEDEFAVTAEMKVNYLSPAMGGRLIGKSQVVKRGRSLSLCQAELFDEQGRLLCYATATFFTFKKRE